MHYICTELQEKPSMLASSTIDKSQQTLRVLVATQCVCTPAFHTAT